MAGEDFVGACKVKTPAEAWAMLVASPALDREFLGGLRGRLVEVVAGHRVPLDTPRTFAGAVALASAPAVMRKAETLVRQAFERAAPFGVGPCPPIVWLTQEPTLIGRRMSDRRRFSPVRDALVEAIGRDAFDAAERPALKQFSFSSNYISIPELLRWAAEDLGRAMQFDAARTAKAVTRNGLAYETLDNPFESLCRIAYEGFLVESVDTDRVVLVADEN